MNRSHWFLPETPDVLGLLLRQIAVTIEGLDAFVGWAGGDASAVRALDGAEHRADSAKRELFGALRVAFVTPLEPEDVFALSRGVDWILDWARDLVNEARVMECSPDAGIAEMAALLRQAVGRIEEAIAHLDPTGPCHRSGRRRARGRARLERTYYRGMASLLEVEDMRRRIASRELYRRCSRIGEMVVDVAERVIYAVVKQS